MKLNRPILNAYLARSYAGHVFSLLFILLAVMALFDSIELMRRFAKTDSDMNLIGYLALLKMPGNVLTITPFVVLFSAMFTLSVFNRRHELMMMRAAGASLWQLIVPFMAVAFAFGVVLVGVINPLSAVTRRSYLQYEEKFLKKESHMISLLGQGLWLRQSAPEEKAGGYILLHARKVSLPLWNLEQVMILFFDDQHFFQQRFDAPFARLESGNWVFPSGMLTRPGAAPGTLTDYRLPTTLTRADLDESFSTPETVSFWQMSGFIHTLKSSGFLVLPLQVRFGNLLMLPLLCAVLVLVAVPVSVYTARSRSSIWFTGIGICLGFVVFFIGNFLEALGGSGQIPLWLACTGTVFLTAAGGALAILNMEDR